MNQTSLNKFNTLIEEKYPEIIEFIRHKENHKILVEVPYNTGNNWNKISESCKTLFSNSPSPIKKTTTSFNEKHSYFSITFFLE